MCIKRMFNIYCWNKVWLHTVVVYSSIRYGALKPEACFFPNIFRVHSLRVAFLLYSAYESLCNYRHECVSWLCRPLDAPMCKTAQGFALNHSIIFSRKDLESAALIVSMQILSSTLVYLCYTTLSYSLRNFPLLNSCQLQTTSQKWALRQRMGLSALASFSSA